jgi:hypothetical protein
MKTFTIILSSLLLMGAVLTASAQGNTGNNVKKDRTIATKKQVTNPNLPKITSTVAGRVQVAVGADSAQANGGAVQAGLDEVQNTTNQVQNTANTVQTIAGPIPGVSKVQAVTGKVQAIAGGVQTVKNTIGAIGGFFHKKKKASQQSVADTSAANHQ